MSEQPTNQVAARVTLSYAPTDERTAAALETSQYRSYLRRAHAGPTSAGDEWTEFVNCGCGTTRDVLLRVESTEGGSAVGEATKFRLEPREE